MTLNARRYCCGVLCLLLAAAALGAAYLYGGRAVTPEAAVSAAADVWLAPDYETVLTRRENGELTAAVIRSGWDTAAVYLQRDGSAYRPARTDLCLRSGGVSLLPLTEALADCKNGGLLVCCGDEKVAFGELTLTVKEAAETYNISAQGDGSGLVLFPLEDALPVTGLCAECSVTLYRDGGGVIASVSIII